MSRRRQVASNLWEQVPLDVGWWWWKHGRALYYSNSIAIMWKIQQLSELYIEEPGAMETCSDSNGIKALGLKYSTLPLAYRSPQLPFAFLFPSPHLSAKFYFPSNFLICCLLYSDGLSAYFSDCSSCLSSSPYNPIAWAVTAQNHPFSAHRLIHSCSHLVLLSCLYSQQGLCRSL